MELHYLRYFETVARLGSFTRAGEELGLAQPSLSQQVRALEARLGVPLFERRGRLTSLTAAGEALLPYARRILALVAEAEQAVSEREGEPRGRVAIGAPPTVGSHLLPRTLAQFNRQYPAVELQLYEAGAQRLQRMVQERSLDLAVVTRPGPPPPGEEDASLEVASLFSEELVIAVSREHPLAAQPGVAMTDLREEAFILFPVGYELRAATLDACRKAGFSPHISLDGAETDTALRSAAAGLGIALVPRLALTGVGDLAPLSVSDQRLSREVVLLWRRDHYLSRAGRALRSFLLTHLPVTAS